MTRPIPPSERFRDIRRTGRWVNYTDADSWFPTWAADGRLFSGFTDGSVNGSECHSWGDPAMTGNAVIEGDDPLDLTVRVVSVSSRPNPRFRGNYPVGNLHHDGVWYYGTHYLEHLRLPSGLAVTWELGPMAGFRTSVTNGATWVESPLDDGRPLFPEFGRARAEDPIRFGGPNFVDFGRNMEASPDGRAYLVGHGSFNRDGIANWCAGDDIVLARVRPSPATINDPDAYEFWAGIDEAGDPIWSRGFDDLRPIISWPGHAGITTMTYIRALGVYLLTVTAGPPNGQGGPYDTWIASAEHVWGPWRLVTYLHRFGTQGYFCTVPSKFVSADGLTAWLMYSANWTEKERAFYNRTRGIAVDRATVAPDPDVYEDPEGSRYGMCLQEFEFVPRAPVAR